MATENVELCCGYKELNDCEVKHVEFVLITSECLIVREINEIQDLRKAESYGELFKSFKQIFSILCNCIDSHQSPDVCFNFHKLIIVTKW